MRAMEGRPRVDEVRSLDPLESPQESAALARRLRQGDTAAFQALYERVAPSLFAWTSMRLSGGAFAGIDSQDVLQEVWLRALQNLDRFDPAQSFRGWLIGIAKKVVLQSHARRPRASFHTDLDGERGELSIPDSVTGASVRLARDESVLGFLRFVEELSEDDRLLVVLCGLEESTCAEAGTRLGISAEAATKRWQALRARLRANGSLRALALDTVE
jgi:RNA polymerase sigma-70 factor, ECF subfamily